MDIIYRINGGALTLLANQTSPTNIAGTAGDSVEVWLSEKQTATVQAAASYTQNVVDTNNTAWLEWALANQPANGTQSQMTVSFWGVDIAPSGNNFKNVILGVDGVSVIARNGELLVRVKDSANTTVYDVLSSGLSFSSTPGSLDHFQVNVNLTTPSIAIYHNGVDVTSTRFSGTISAGTGFIRSGIGGYQIPQNNGVDFHFADVLLSYGENISNASLYNGGTPPDPGTLAGGALIGNPQILLGGDMVASDWNSRSNIGTGTLNAGAGSTTFTDVP